MSEPDLRSLAKPEPDPVGGGEASSSATPTKSRSRAVRWIIEVAVIVAAAFVLAFLIHDQIYYVVGKIE